MKHGLTLEAFMLVNGLTIQHSSEWEDYLEMNAQISGMTKEEWLSYYGSPTVGILEQANILLEKKVTRKQLDKALNSLAKVTAEMKEIVGLWRDAKNKGNSEDEKKYLEELRTKTAEKQDAEKIVQQGIEALDANVGLEIVKESVNEARANAKKLLKSVIKGETNSVEGIKLSKDMAQGFLDWLEHSTYGKKFSDLPFDKLFTASFNWGLDRYVKGAKTRLKDEFKELKSSASEMKESVKVYKLDRKLKKKLDAEYDGDYELKKHQDKKDKFYELLLKHAPFMQWSTLKKEVAELFGFDNLEPGSNDGEMLEYFYDMVRDELGIKESVNEATEVTQEMWDKDWKLTKTYGKEYEEHFAKRMEAAMSKAKHEEQAEGWAFKNFKQLPNPAKGMTIEESLVNEKAPFPYNLGYKGKKHYWKYPLEIGDKVKDIEGIKDYHKQAQRGGQTAVQDISSRILIRTIGRPDIAKDIVKALKGVDDNLDLKTLKNNYDKTDYYRSQNDQERDIWQWEIQKKEDFHSYERKYGGKPKQDKEFTRDHQMEFIDMLAPYSTTQHELADINITSLEDFLQYAADHVSPANLKKVTKRIKKEYPKLENNNIDMKHVLTLESFSKYSEINEEKLNKSDLSYQLTMDYTGRTKPKITKLNKSFIQIMYGYKINPQDVIDSIHTLYPDLDIEHVEWSDKMTGGGFHKFAINQ